MNRRHPRFQRGALPTELPNQRDTIIEAAPGDCQFLAAVSLTRPRRRVIIGWMPSAAQFLAVLEEKDILPPEVLGALRKTVRETAQPPTARALADWLVRQIGRAHV